ncbi:TRAP transporter large permease [Clostridium aestuarii]|uniref:TRAP transporter large permease n=1 Tax=Clostridium aestuarii TaxID=338193 RepID=A0ABT4D1E2_9CLOT|nr:TRAP transporter large permease [Clostridium aestuarii]MCY6484130.1 TRAP transporter large permease [Clostridium aestuarii]
MTLLLFGTLFILLILNIPIGVSLGLASITALTFGDMPTPSLVVAQRMFTSVDSFPFMAIPFFMLAGGLMEHGGISKRLIKFAEACVGTVGGGLAIITIIASAFFGAISGSNPATVAAIGGIMIPAMVKAGYPKDFASAVAAAGGTLGVVIPPSIPMITYGVVAGVSISTLFIAGIVPGIILAIGLMVVISIYAKKLDLPKGKPTNIKKIIAAFKEAILALLMPIIILGGIYGGVFTPTEAAAVAVVYAFIVSVFIYKEIKVKDLSPIIVKAATSTSVVLFVIATSASFSWIITSAQIPAKVTTAMMGLTSNVFVITLLINIMLLFLGSFLETQAIILLVAPILLPLMTGLGISPILLGIIIVVNTSVGMITPPMAVNLFVACGISGLKVEQISKKILAFLITEIVIVLLITNFPQISLFLPSILK